MSAYPSTKLLLQFCLLGSIVMGLGHSLRGGVRLPVDYSIKRWASSEQFPLLTVEALAQTRDGFLWFAMNGGLGRFDGMTLEVFDSQNTPELPVSLVTAIVEDRNENLWIGTAGGGLLLWKKGQFERFASPQGLLNEQVKTLCLGRDGRLWIGTDGGGIFVRESSGQFRNYRLNGEPKDAFIVGLKLTETDQLIALTIKGGVFVLKGDGFEPVAVEPALHERRGLSLTQSDSGRVWLGSRDGVYLFKDGRFDRWRPSQELPNINPVMAWETGTNEVWLGTDRSLIHWRNGDWAEYPIGGAASPRMSNGFLVDREGSVWISTEGGGLVQLRRTVVVTLGAAEGLAGNEVTSVLMSQDRGLWVGTTHGLTRLDAKGVRQYGRSDGLLDDCVFSLIEDPVGAIWVSTRKGGLARWTGDKFLLVPNGHASIGPVAWCLARGDHGSIWAGTPAGAYQYREGVLQRRITGSDGLSNEDVRCILDEGNGVVWFGTSYGLNRLDGHGMTHYSVTPNKEPIEVVVALSRDDDDGLWIGTMARGLFRLKNEQFTRYSTTDGLPDNAIHSIANDGEGNLWLGTGGGLARVTKASLHARESNPQFPLDIRVLHRADGLRSEEFTGTIQPTVARSPDGRLWFATADGLATLLPSSMEPSRNSPLISLLRVAVEGPRIISALRGKSAEDALAVLSPIREMGLAPAPAGRLRAVFAPEGIETLIIPPGQERLDFQFVSPSFVAPRAVTYRFRLDGFDTQWVEAGNRQAAYYTRVPPGHYRFQVQARSETGQLSERVASLGLVVKPAWWQWRTLQAGSVAAFLGSIIVFFQNRIRGLRAAREHAALFSRQLIRSQEQERARISGELHDGLGQELQLIRNRAELALQQFGRDNALSSHLGSISETAARAIQGVRALSRGLRPPELDQLGLTQALRWLGQNVRESFSGELEARIEMVDGALDKAQEVDFYRVAQEALNNAVKHSGASEITFEVQWAEAGLQLSVFDNGRGFETAASTQPGKLGSGLKNMNERAALLRGNLDLHTVLQVGTRLTLQVPLLENRRSL
jgi:signal transduction histidine kinase/ligand-binding sensor domain-containing protein